MLEPQHSICQHWTNWEVFPIDCQAARMRPLRSASAWRLSYPQIMWKNTDQGGLNLAATFANRAICMCEGKKIKIKHHLFPSNISHTHTHTGMCDMPQHEKTWNPEPFKGSLWMAINVHWQTHCPTVLIQIFIPKITKPFWLDTQSSRT